MNKHLERIGGNSALSVEVTKEGVRLGATGLLGIVGLLAALVLILGAL
jgi:hypothetical protein